MNFGVMIGLSVQRWLSVAFVWVTYLQPCLPS